MKKLVAITCIVVLCLSFAVTGLTPSAEAKGCVQTCIGGVLLVCCPIGDIWDCRLDGPCDWGPEPPW